MSGQVFADETKHRDYLMVAAVVLPADVAPLRGLVLPGQRRVHTQKKSAPRRRLIADSIVRSGVTAVIFDAANAYPGELDARQACLRGVISYADDAGATRLVPGRDDSLLPGALLTRHPDPACLDPRTAPRGTADQDP